VCNNNRIDGARCVDDPCKSTDDMCADQGLACRDGECMPECDDVGNSDCMALGYPEMFECNFATGAGICTSGP